MVLDLQSFALCQVLEFVFIPVCTKNISELCIATQPIPVSVLMLQTFHSEAESIVL